MKKYDLLRSGDTIIRVLEVQGDRVLMIDCIRWLQGDGTTRPRRVTVFAVEKMLHLTSKKISLYLPQCLAEIRKHEETQEQYWAREVVWAANLLRAAGSPLVWHRIRALTNMRRRDLETCLPYVSRYTDEELVSQLSKL